MYLKQIHHDREGLRKGEGETKLECMCLRVRMVLSHLSTLLPVGTVVKVHAQLGRLHVSVDLSFPVVDQRGGTDDQSSFRSYEGGI